MDFFLARALRVQSMAAWAWWLEYEATGHSLSTDTKKGG